MNLVIAKARVALIVVDGRGLSAPDREAVQRIAMELLAVEQELRDLRDPRRDSAARAGGAP